MFKRLFFVLIVLVFLGMNGVLAQTPDPQQGVHGDRRFRRWGQMNGNLVNAPFINYGMIGNWPANPDPAEWPQGSGEMYVEGATPIVVTEVVDINGDTVHIAEIGYREGMDVGPDGTVWGYEPRPGWFNLDGETPAISDDRNSWPSEWPDKRHLADDPGWPGAWNGYFGKNQFQADKECFFVMDDYQDKEFAFFPDAADSSRGGLGTLVKVRGLQWSQVLAEDCIFWLYRITNFSNYTYSPLFFWNAI